MSRSRLKKSSLDVTNVQKNAFWDIVEKKYHEEIQRVQVQHFEILRRIEAGRLKAENQLETLEEKYAELDESYRNETRRLNVELIHTKDALLIIQKAFDELDKKKLDIENERKRLEQEHQALLERLKAEKARNDELEALEEKYAELDESHRNEAKRLNDELFHSRNTLLTIKKAFDELDKKNLDIENERKRLVQEHQDLLKQLQAEKSRNTEAYINLERDRDFYCQMMLAAEQQIYATNNCFFQRVRQALQTKSGWRRLASWPKAACSAILNPRNQANEWLNQIEEIFIRYGTVSAEAFIRRYCIMPIDLAAGLTSLARLAVSDNINLALRLAQEATKIDPRPFRRKWLAFLAFDAGNIDLAHKMLISLPAEISFKPSEKNRAEYIAGLHRLMHGKFLLPEASTIPEYTAVTGRILYVAASVLPYHNTGYTLRTHALLQALQKTGAEVLCVTRPGYPEDRPDSKRVETAGVSVIDGVRYETLLGPHRRKLGLDQYLLKSAEILIDKARAEKPSIIHAASNYEVALPALIAARTLGIPFIYEVRGLWEYTAASKKKEWEQSQRFALESHLETLTAQNADQVLPLTEALANELESRGVEPTKITLVPNAVDSKAFTPTQRNPALAEALGIYKENFVIGYVGSIVGYEGLDDLIEALGLLQARLPLARALIVGDGDKLAALKRMAKERGLADHIQFSGKVAPSEVRDYYALMNVIVLPRKPVTVCQLVSPLKPLEAMALRIPLVVSDVAALREMVQDGETALVHLAGNARSLADCIELLAKKSDLSERLTENAHRYVTTHCAWEPIAARIAALYHKLESKKEFTTSKDVPIPAIDLTPISLPPGKNTLDDDGKSMLDQKLNIAIGQGINVLSTFVAAQCVSRSKSFASFCKLRAAHVCLGKGAEDEALRLVETTLEEDASITCLRGAARIFYNAAQLERAEAVVAQLEKSLTEVKAGDRIFFDEVRGRTQLVAWAALPTQPRSIPITPKRVLNLLAFSLPYTSVGYATRSHGLALGIREAGWDIRPYTRPGFPKDFKPTFKEQSLPAKDVIDGIVYRRNFDFNRKEMNEVEYLHSAIASYERIIREEQPEVVHAASNYVTALPALIAARRLGVPFIYEIRGFWEITRLSRNKNFKYTPKYRFMQLFEEVTARCADSVITITSAMKKELIARGVPAQRIPIAYNGVDPERFLPRPRDQELAVELGIPAEVQVIGYVGSFVDYEGLDDLIAACVGLKADGYDFRLLMVGDGDVFEDLKLQAAEAGVDDITIFTDRVPHDQVEKYYSLIDIAPFPRKPWDVCDLVSPLKPYEAMALEKAVVVSSNQALTEIVNHGNNGLVFTKGDVDDLRRKLEMLLLDSTLRSELGMAARKWIQQERSWYVSAQLCSHVYKEILS